MPLHYAASGGHQDIAKELIAHGGDINIKNKKGDTPLHYAVSRGHQEIAKELIVHGGISISKTRRAIPLFQLRKRKINWMS